MLWSIAVHIFYLMLNISPRLEECIDDSKKNSRDYDVSFFTFQHDIGLESGGLFNASNAAELYIFRTSRPGVERLHLGIYDAEVILGGSFCDHAHIEYTQQRKAAIQ